MLVNEYVGKDDRSIILFLKKQDLGCSRFTGNW